MPPESARRRPGLRLLGLLSWCAQKMPRRLAIAVGDSLGAAAYHLARRGKRRAARTGICRFYRDTAKKNLTHAFTGPGPSTGSGRGPERTERVEGPRGRLYSKREIADVARGCFRCAGRSLFETLRVPAMTEREVKSIVDEDSFAPLEKVLSRGKGAVVLAPHVGAWELGGACLAAHVGKPIYAVALRLGKGAHDEMIMRVRRSYGIEIIHQDRGAKPILKALRRNRPVVLLADTFMMGIAGVYVDFFGRPAYMSIGPAALSRMSRAAIVPMYIHWKGLRHGGRVLREIEPVRTRDRDADVLEMTTRWVRVVEDVIRAYPEQWPWFLRRWRGEA